VVDDDEVKSGNWSVRISCVGLKAPGVSLMNARFFVCILLVIGSAGVGCASLGTGLHRSDPPVATGTYSVQVKGGFPAKGIKNYPLHEGTTVQTVLDDSGQTSLHRDFEIDVLRKTSTSEGIVKMPVQFDAGKQRVKFETDYAIYPGDHVIIRPLSFSPFEQVASMLGGPSR